MATDVESFGEILNKIKELKRLLNSKSNSFFFMTTLVIDTINDVAAKYLEYVENKIKYINYYIDNNIIPPADDPLLINLPVFSVYIPEEFVIFVEEMEMETGDNLC